ncbi:hypothetical protein Mal15_30110 [Stieleria maiorica]|uniref:Secreted protein n=1 Tax=Stieleria maiorica TaxID=2795974 RepID=A0A5B9MDS5_9BACT|nr:hypothetical protein [Stieleria maiorica]QEF98953.1 hypothetical protein Mal15_30110 [Stieleria maiorica]
MKRLIATLSFGLLFVSLTGCPSPSPDAVTDADQSAIDAYLATEAEEQASLQTEMKDSAKAAK